MNINIKATGIELTEAISQYVEKRIRSVEKYCPKSEAVLASVEVGKSTHHHKSGDFFRAEVHLTGAGLDIYAVSEQDDLYAAIDLVKDEVVQKLTHTKDKKMTVTRRGAQMVKNMMKGLNFFRRRK